MIVNTTKLTFDTDDRRINASPSIVVCNNNRHIIFYEKYFTSGLISYSSSDYVRKISDLQISVPSGSGMINGYSVSWIGESKTLPTNSYIVVRVDTSGVIYYDTSWNMNIIASSIILAYINVGNSEIVYIENIEKDGKYIYGRIQKQISGEWVWTDDEQILCTGEQPRAYYDSSLNKVFLSYKKDSIIYLRVFDMNSELTWRYLPNTKIEENVITINQNPEMLLNIIGSSAIKSIGDIYNLDLYPMSSTGLGFIEISGEFKPHIFLPFLIFTDNFKYLEYPYYLEICSKTGSSYIVEKSYDFYENNLFSNRWVQWTGTLGTKYIRVRASCRLMMSEFVTSVPDYKTIEIFNPFENRIIDGNNISSDVISNFLNVNTSSGIKSSLVKTYEYEETRDFKEDLLVVKCSSGIKSFLTKTYEYEETRDFEEESPLAIKASSCFKSLLQIT